MMSTKKMNCEPAKLKQQCNFLEWLRYGFWDAHKLHALRRFRDHQANRSLEKVESACVAFREP